MRVRGWIDAGQRHVFRDDLESGLLKRHPYNRPQIVVPEALRARLLHLAHALVAASHPGGRKLYQTLGRDYYWPYMAPACYLHVRNCRDCARERVSFRRVSKALRLFPARSPLEDVSLDILKELLRTPRGNRYLLVITCRFSKLTRVVPLKRVRAWDIAHAFVTHWVFPYGAPWTLLSENGKQLTAKFFQHVCSVLGVKNLFTTTYHPQATGQCERFIRTALSSLLHYVTDHPTD